MLVDINLLPKKEKKNYSQIMLLVLLILILILGGVFFFLKYQQTQKEIETKEAALRAVQTAIETTQQKELAKDEGNAVLQLQKAVDWAEDVPIPTAFLLSHLVDLLPERGFFMDFNYENTGEVALVVQFDTKLQASYYLKELKESNYIKEVALTNVEADFIIGSDEEEIAKENYVPRYSADFELELDEDTLRKDAAEEGEEDVPSDD